MPLFKCKMCGGSIEANEAGSVVACEYCGTNQVAPQLIDDDNEIKKVIEDKRKKINRKKTLIVIMTLVAIFALFMILFLTHIICFHSYSEATVLKPQTCYHCDKTVGSPKPLTEISFPNKGLGALLPTPKSKLGDVTTDSTDYFFVYVGNVTLSDFNAYVNECFEMGFNLDYTRYNSDGFGHEYYHAEDINGNSLFLRYYEDGSIMEITMRAP